MMGIDGFLPDSVKLFLLGLMAAVFVLSRAARRYPQVDWLQKFQLRDYRTEEQKRRARRSGNIMAGIEMILMGLAIPAVYFVTGLRQSQSAHPRTRPPPPNASRQAIAASI